MNDPPPVCSVESFLPLMLCTLLWLPLVASAPSDTLAEIRARGFFVWGADEEGGSPAASLGSR